MPLKLGREAEITYDQLILLQLSRCSKPMDTLYFARCVMNFLALLPPDIRLEVQKRKGAILQAIEKEEEAFCGPPPSSYESLNNYRKCIAEKANAIARKVAEELNAKSYYYIIHSLITIEWGTSSYNQILHAYNQHLLSMSIAVDILHERGLIGFKEKPLYVGAVDVPRKSDKVGHGQ
jgi:hypothetical protein